MIKDLELFELEPFLMKAHLKALMKKMTFLFKDRKLTNVVATIPDIPPSKKFLTLWEVEVVATTGTLGTAA